jgi:1-acyl-sn-glycerol-3-phosphate acyltransferase
MHALDLPVVFAVVPRRQTVFAANKWRGKFAGWLMQIFADAIFVERGEPDRQAIAKALEVVRLGGALGVAPEGTRSRTGGLIDGKPGTVYLASRSGAPILPMVVWGQERAMRQWAHLRRAEIHVRIAEPMILPPGAEQARSVELASYTDQLMLTLARMLPREYRGVYARRVEEHG